MEAPRLFIPTVRLAGILRESLKQAGLPEDAVQFVETTDRQAVLDLLGLEEYVDVMIPRGGEDLIRFVTKNARMPVLKHYKGVCHVYVDSEADLEMARKICLNAKVQRPATCNAMETLLVHEAIAESFLPAMAEEFRRSRRRVARLPKDQGACARLRRRNRGGLARRVPRSRSRRACSGRTWTKLSATSQDMALNIPKPLLRTNFERAHRFVRQVQSSLVLVNASTRFNDGFQLGLGAEIGISTSRLHAFGPMGVEELTTTKFIAFGNGQLRG